MKINKKVLFSCTTAVVLGLFSGCSNSDGSSSSEASTSAQWYARTSVSAINPSTQTAIVHKTAGVFGQLDESSDGQDRHDILGMGTVSATLEVVFLLEDAEGDYFSDYHSVKKGSDSWTFQIKNMYNPDHPVNLSNETIKIALEGIYTVETASVNGSIRYSETLNEADKRLNQLTLIDLDNGVAYAYTDLKSAAISMDGLHVRTFRWVLGSIEDSDFLPPAVPAPLKAAVFATPSSQMLQTAPQTTGKFGLPPQ